MFTLGATAMACGPALHVVKLGSATQRHDAVFDEIAALRRRGARLLVVAGGADGIAEHYARIDRPVRMLRLRNGDRVRYCPAEEMPHIVAAYESVTLPEVERRLSARGLSVFAAVAGRGGLVRASVNPPLRAVDQGRARVVRDHRAGTVSGVDVDRLSSLLDAFDVVCLSPPVAADAKDGDDGEAMVNVDADVLAAELANALRADHLRLVTGTAGLLADPEAPSSTVRHAAVGEGRSLARGRMRQKVRAAELALDGTGDVAITGPHTLSAVGGTRFWRARPPADDLELLSRAVEVSSVSGDERELAEFLAAWCADRGVDADVDARGNLVATRGTADDSVPGGRLLLLGHLDTVPHRWPVRWDGDTITGRGSVDAKGSLVAYLEMLAGFEPPPGTQVRVVGAVEEETTADGAFFARDHYPADAVIVGEPSGSAALTIGYYGLLKVRLSVSERVGHTAGKGVMTAADRLVGVLHRLRDEITEVSPDVLTAVLGVHATNRGDVQAGEAVVDVRVPPRVDLDELTAVFHRVAAAPMRVEVLRATPGVHTGRSSTLVRAFSRAFRASDVTPRFLLKKGSSDMNTLATTWRGVPMVAYGPGNAELDHTPHERLDAPEFRRARRVLDRAVREWADVAVPSAAANGRP